jgi:putative MATE family efflux protein
MRASAASANIASPGGILGVLRDAVAGVEHDYTHGPIGRAVVILAVPMILEMAMESTFAVCDVFFVSRLGVTAVAAVGLTEAVLAILYALGGGIATATTAMVARRVGEKRGAEAASATAQAIAVGFVVAALAGITGATFAGNVLALMGASDAVVRDGSPYTAVLLGGSGTIVLLFIVNAAFRGAGDAAMAMRVLWLANAVNLVLDPCLIFGIGPFPQLGITGAAIATTLGRGTGVLYQVVALLRGRGYIRLDPPALRIRLGLMLRLLLVSVGGIAQHLIATTSWVALMRVVGGFGSAAVAGYAIAIRIVVFALLPSWGVANSAATLVGQNLGAGRADRAARSVWTAALYNVFFLFAVGAFFVVGAELLIGVFSSEVAVLAHGADCLRVVSYGFVFYGLGMVVVQGFNGAGDTLTPTAINVVAYWLVQVPAAYALAHGAGLGPHGVFIAVAGAESLLTVIAVVIFCTGRWKTRSI